MAAVTICSDFGAPKIKSDTASTVSPSIYQRLTFRSQEIATLKSLQKSQDMSDILPQKEGN